MQPVVHIQQDQLDKAILAWTHELAPHGVFTTDSNLTITSWNQWLERHSSLPASQVVGRALFDIIPSLPERRLEQYFRDALNGEAKIVSTALHKYLLPMPPPDRAIGFSHMQQSARIAPLMLGGEVWGTITIVEDVTEREWQNAILRRERQRDELLSAALRQLLSSRSYDLSVRDIFSRIAGYLQLDVCLHHRFDSAAQRLFLQSAVGLPPDQIEDASLFELGEGLIGAAARNRQPMVVMDVQSSEDPKALFFKRLELGTFLVFPLAIGENLLGTLAFGTCRQKEFAAEDVAFLEGISQFVAIAFQRVIQEEGLRQSEERFRELAETVPDIIFTATPGGRCDFINQRFARITGLSAEKALGFGWMQAIHPEDTKGVEGAWRKSVQTGQPYSHEYRLRLEEGDYRWVVARARAVRDEGGNIAKWFGAVTDVDELKKMHLELSRAQTQLQEYTSNLEETVFERTASLRETISHLESFSYTVAHDLRAPIRAVEGYTDILLEDHGAALPEEVSSVLEKIRRSAQRLDALTRDVLNYTKASTEAIELRPVNFEALLHEIIEMNPALQVPRASVAIVRPLHSVIAHPTLLAQCLSNLLDNAVKFVRPDEMPRIIVRSEIADEDPGIVRLWVEDNGIGMDELTRNKVFGIFERGRGTDRFPGTGIGLAIVAKAIQRMRGEYGVDSEIDTGSRFWLKLPLAESP